MKEKIILQTVISFEMVLSDKITYAYSAHNYDILLIISLNGIKNDMNLISGMT